MGGADAAFGTDTTELTETARLFDLSEHRFPPLAFSIGGVLFPKPPLSIFFRIRWVDGPPIFRSWLECQQRQARDVVAVIPIASASKLAS